MGMLASAYHLTRTYTTEASTSLWAVPPRHTDPDPTATSRPSAIAPAPAHEATVPMYVHDATPDQVQSVGAGGAADASTARTAALHAPASRHASM
eukprot:jgi/Ulvmu1/3300/UM153_0012.1